MSNIEQHIANLLQQFDCVILPDFGGFIATVENGRFDEKSDVFHPPYKRILFNKNLTNNDGLLANELVAKEALSYTQANSLLNEYKNHCFARLNNEGRIEIERVGVLFFDQEKNLQFQQSTNNLLVSSFGLTPKYLNPLPVLKQIEETKVVEPIVRVEQTVVDRPAVKPVKKEEKKNRKRIAYYIPLIAVPLLLGGLFFANQTGYIGDSKLQLSNLNPFGGNKIATYQPRVSIIEEAITIPVQPVVEEEVILKEETVVKVDSTYYHVDKAVFEELKYHVVGGCFSSQENANSLVSSWEEKGNKAHVIDKHKSLYRVSIQSFSTRSEANSFKKALKSNQGVEAWILKK